MAITSRQARKYVKRFFEILDTKELSANFVEFNPTYIRMDKDLKVEISSVRVLRVVELDKILRELKEWSQ